MRYTVDMAIIWYALGMMVLDIVTGFCCGLKNNDLSSSKMREGLWHKSAFLAAIVLSVIVTHGAESVEVFSEMLGDLCIDSVCAYIILTEVVSVLENICILNPQLGESKLGKLFKNDAKIEEARAESPDNANMGGTDA